MSSIREFSQNPTPALEEESRLPEHQATLSDTGRSLIVHLLEAVDVFKGAIAPQTFRPFCRLHFQNATLQTVPSAAAEAVVSELKLNWTACFPLPPRDTSADLIIELFDRSATGETLIGTAKYSPCVTAGSTFDGSVELVPRGSLRIRITTSSKATGTPSLQRYRPETEEQMSPTLRFQSHLRPPGEQHLISRGSQSPLFAPSTVRQTSLNRNISATPRETFVETVARNLTRQTSLITGPLGTPQPVGTPQPLGASQPLGGSQPLGTLQQTYQQGNAFSRQYTVNSTGQSTCRNNVISVIDSPNFGGRQAAPSPLMSPQKHPCIISSPSFHSLKRDGTPMHTTMNIVPSNTYFRHLPSGGPRYGMDVSTQPILRNTSTPLSTSLSTRPLAIQSAVPYMPHGTSHVSPIHSTVGTIFRRGPEAAAVSQYPTMGASSGNRSSAFIHSRGAAPVTRSPVWRPPSPRMHSCTLTQLQGFERHSSATGCHSTMNTHLSTCSLPRCDVVSSFPSTYGGSSRPAPAVAPEIARQIDAALLDLLCQDSVTQTQSIASLEFSDDENRAMPKELTSSVQGKYRTLRLWCFSVSCPDVINKGSLLISLDDEVIYSYPLAQHNLGEKSIYTDCGVLVPYSAERKLCLALKLTNTAKDGKVNLDLHALAEIGGRCVSGDVFFRDAQNCVVARAAVGVALLVERLPGICLPLPPSIQRPMCLPLSKSGELSRFATAADLDFQGIYLKSLFPSIRLTAIAESPAETSALTNGSPTTTLKVSLGTTIALKSKITFGSPTCSVFTFPYSGELSFKIAALEASPYVNSPVTTGVMRVFITDLFSNEVLHKAAANQNIAIDAPEVLQVKCDSSETVLGHVRCKLELLRQAVPRPSVRAIDLQPEGSSGDTTSGPQDETTPETDNNSTPTLSKAFSKSSITCDANGLTSESRMHQSPFNDGEECLSVFIESAHLYLSAATDDATVASCPPNTLICFPDGLGNLEEPCCPVTDVDLYAILRYGGQTVRTKAIRRTNSPRLCTLCLFNDTPAGDLADEGAIERIFGSNGLEVHLIARNRKEKAEEHSNGVTPPLVLARTAPFQTDDLAKKRSFFLLEKDKKKLLSILPLLTSSGIAVGEVRLVIARLKTAEMISICDVTVPVELPIARRLLQRQRACFTGPLRDLARSRFHEEMGIDIAYIRKAVYGRRDAHNQLVCLSCTDRNNVSAGQSGSPSETNSTTSHSVILELALDCGSLQTIFGDSALFTFSSANGEPVGAEQLINFKSYKAAAEAAVAAAQHKNVVGDANEDLGVTKLIVKLPFTDDHIIVDVMEPGGNESTAHAVIARQVPLSLLQQLQKKEKTSPSNPSLPSTHVELLLPFASHRTFAEAVLPALKDADTAAVPQSFSDVICCVHAKVAVAPRRAQAPPIDVRIVSPTKLHE